MVRAEFSVFYSCSTEGDEREVVAWAEKNYLRCAGQRNFRDYLRAGVAKLEAVPADKFAPNLELLEQLISTSLS